MRKCRKMISVIMLMVMLVSLLPTGAMAAEAPTGATNEVAAVEEPQGNTDEAKNEDITNGEANKPEDTSTDTSDSGAKENDGTNDVVPTDGTTVETTDEDPAEGTNTEDAGLGNTSTEDAGLGNTSTEIAAVVEPKTETETKDAANAGEPQDLETYINGRGGSIVAILYIKDASGAWVEMTKNKDGAYTITDKTQSYRLVVNIGCGNGIAPGKYTHTFDINADAIDYYSDSTIVQGEMKVGERFFGTYSLDGNTVETTFENSNDLQGIRINQYYSLDFNKVTTNKFDVFGVKIVIPDEPVAVPTVEKKGNLDKTTGIITWEVNIDTSNGSNVVGRTITDYLHTESGNNGPHEFIQDEVTVTATNSKDTSQTISWNACNDTDNFEWTSKTKFTYKVPASWGGMEFGPYWNFKLQYKTKVTKTPSEAGQYLYYGNSVNNVWDGSTKAASVLWRIGVKSAKSVTVNDNRTKASWKCTGTYTELNKDERMGMIDATCKVSQGGGYYAMDEADEPAPENMVVKLSYYEGDTHYDLTLGTSPTSENNGLYYSIEKNKTYWQNPRGWRILIRKEGQSKGSGVAATEDKKAIVTITYDTELTEAFMKLMFEKGYSEWQNRCAFYIDSDWGGNATANVKIPGWKKTHTDPTEDNGHKATFKIVFTPTEDDEDLGELKQITLTDTMSRTLFIYQDTINVTATDYYGRDVGEVSWTHDYDNKVLKIYINDPHRYTYTVTYDCKVLATVNPEVQFSNKYYVNEHEEWEKEDHGIGHGLQVIAETYRASLVKTDESGAPLKGAEIGLFTAKGNRMKRETTGDDGKVSFKTDVENDVIYEMNTAYYLQETKAPSGFVEDKTKKWFVFTDSEEEGHSDKAYWENYFKNEVGAKEGDYQIVNADKTTTDGSSVTFFATEDFGLVNKSEGTSLTVTKKWEDLNNVDNTRPTSITVQLLANNKKEGAPVTLTADKNFTYTWTGLKKNDENGNPISYSVSEEAVSGYNEPVVGTTKEVKDKAGNVIGYTVEITNTLTPKTQVSVKKVWDDFNNDAKKRPASITVQLLADGKVVTGSQVTLDGKVDDTEKTAWEYTWEDLDKYGSDGKTEIKYTVDEVSVPEGYTKTINGNATTGYTINNSYMPKVNIAVEKIWDDSNDQDGLRPTSITVKLLADGKEVEGSQVILDGKVDDKEKEVWKYTWENLDKFSKETNAEIKYTVDEVSVPKDYTKTISGDATVGYKIKNTHSGVVTQVSVEKVWDDNNDQDGIRPESITVKLLADGKEVEGSQVVLDGKVDDKEKEAWKYTWENLPKNKDGVAIKYTVDEVSVPKDYTKTISGDATVGYKINNKHTGVPTRVSVEKIWDDNNDQDGIRPESITIKLLADGKEVEDSQVTLDGKVDDKEKEAWKYTWENLPKNKAGVEIKYTVDEVSVPKDYTKTISGNATVGYKINNKHTGVPTRVPVEKIWDDSNDQDRLRPTSITVKLLADGKEVEGSQVTLDGKVDDKEKEAWKYTWENLPKNKDGVEINYTVDEVSVPKDYTKSISGDATVGYKIKNTHRKDTTEVSVKKDWADHNDQDEARPESITVQLLADGKIVEGSQVTLDGKIDDKEKAAWNYTWENLDKNKDGVEIKYTVDEVSVPEGYTKSISGDAKTGYTITNTHKERKVSISKVDATSMKEVKGAKIQLIDAKGNEVDKWTSTDDGKPHVVHGLTPGAKYTLHETVEPLGYTIASDTTFSVDAEGKVTSSGTVTEGNVVLVEDSMTKVNVRKVDAANDKELPGATLQILDSNGNVVTVKDHEGNDVKCEWVSTEEDHVVEGLTAGVEYTLRETITPPGFTITSDTKFTIDNNNKVTSDGTVSKTNDGTPVLVVKDNMTVVEVSKVAITGEKELKGANIQILDDKGNIVTVKDHEGNDVKCEWVSTGKPHKVEGLEINKTYTLHETIQPDGYTIATDATFSIDKDNNVTYSGKKNDSGVLLIEDEPTKVKISKTDVAHEKELQGATLQILDSEGNVVEIKDNDGKVVEKCEWASGKEPKYIEGLKTNVVYTLRETIAPNGYTIATDIQFTIKDDGKVESTGKTIKAEETEDGVEVLLVEDEPTKLYVSKQAVTGDEELPGATLQILDEEENVVVIKDNDGNTVDTLEWKSGEEPKYIEGLPTGVNYILREKISPDGYAIASDTKFSIDENGVVTSDGTTSTAEDGTTVLVVKDDFTTVQISKVDAQSEKELEGAKLQIIDEENNIVEEWTSTKEVHVVRGLVANKKYILREQVAPLGYTLTTDTTFSIDMHNVVTSTGPVNKDGVILVNDTMTEVEILKVDSKTGKGLAGAKLQVLDDNGKVCDEWTSTKDAHKIKGLYTGVKYTLHEVEAPKGYDKAKDITFTIDTAGKVSSDALDNGKIVMKDTPTPSKSKNKTGDEANGALWALLLMMAGGALGGTVWFRRKRRA